MKVNVVKEFSIASDLKSVIIESGNPTFNFKPIISYYYLLICAKYISQINPFYVKLSDMLRRKVGGMQIYPHFTENCIYNNDHIYPGEIDSLKNYYIYTGFNTSLLRPYSDYKKAELSLRRMGREFMWLVNEFNSMKNLKFVDYVKR